MLAGSPRRSTWVEMMSHDLLARIGADLVSRWNGVARPGGRSRATTDRSTPCSVVLRRAAEAICRAAFFSPTRNSRRWSTRRRLDRRAHRHPRAPHRRARASAPPTSPSMPRATRSRNAKVEPGAIDLMIVATSTPDQTFPATRRTVQDRLGIHRAPPSTCRPCARVSSTRSRRPTHSCGQVRRDAGDRRRDLLPHPDWTDRSDLRAVRRRGRRGGGGSRQGSGVGLRRIAASDLESSLPRALPRQALCRRRTAVDIELVAVAAVGAQIGGQNAAIFLGAGRAPGASSTTAPAPSPNSTQVVRSVQSRMREKVSPPITSARLNMPARNMPSAVRARRRSPSRPLAGRRPRHGGCRAGPAR